MYSKQRIEYIFPQDHELFAFDSTTISCSIALMGWVLGKYSKALDEIDIVRNAIYTMDKAYVTFWAVARFDAEGAYFVLRAKTNMKYDCVQQLQL